MAREKRSDGIGLNGERRRYAFFGAAPDTTNRGVSALFRSLVEGVATEVSDSTLLVFDNGVGFRDATVALESGRIYPYQRVGARGGKRYYAPENLTTMAALATLRSPLVRFHPVLRALDQCDAVLDVSGGDSFSDIYGPQRFWNIVRPKLIAKRRGIPLILLPQTYGPFRDPRFRNIAREAVLSAEMAWARDPRSYEALKSLLGVSFDPERHKEGVDMAFMLQPADPGTKLAPRIRDWIEARDVNVLAGINVSGLVALDPREARRRFLLRADYPRALQEFITRLLEAPNVRLLLIPHVMSPPGEAESDAQACEQVLQALPSELHERIQITPRNLDEREVKWVISKLDWFCGMRMHSTIAALSSRVPTTAVAYSDKTRGVFETCSVGDQVLDPRELDTLELVARLDECWNKRADTAQVLAGSIDDVKARATEQLHLITEVMKRGSARPHLSRSHD
jgi:polysaccharide pyruvyl transferase WcaK-like protein